MELLNESIDRQHRAYVHITQGNDVVPVLCARAPKKAWPIHPQWVPRYVFLLVRTCIYIFANVFILVKLDVLFS